MHASFTGYEDDILDFISNLHVQKSKFGGKIYQFGGKSREKNELPGFQGVRFFHVWSDFVVILSSLY